ncbi:MAG: hypothetical protein NTZ87_02190 [Candidatus Nomurabacteria bacterium]|nr:hypothetical protein [Candidatus Nomurabacteria bacterium]
MLQFTSEQFKEVKRRGEEFYKSLDEVYCPYFKEKITFNAQGLEHLKFKQREKARYEQDQYMRFKLLHLAPEVLKISSSVQGIWETKRFEYLKINKKWGSALKNVTYYEFIAVLKRNRVKIIIKQIDSGKKIFWSIIPFWGMNKETMTRILHEGNPEED